MFRLTTSAGAQLRAALGVTTDLAVASASALATLPEQPEADAPTPKAFSTSASAT